MTSTQIVPALVASFVAWRIYARVRRNIGRQPWQPKRLIGRAIFFGVISALYAVAVAMNPPMLGALAGGMALGVLLAFWGLHLTEFAATSEGKFYTPNLWIGLTLTLMFAGRIAYRMIAAFSQPMPDSASASTLFQSPLTVAMFGLTAGYYVAYNIDVVRRGRNVLGDR